MEDHKFLRLTGRENYAVWRFQLNVLSDSNGYYEVIMKGKNVAADKNKENAEDKTWKKADREAQKLIITSLLETVLSNLVTCTTAEQVVVKIEAMYGSSLEFWLSKLQIKFNAFSYKSNSISEHISSLEMIAHQMTVLGDKISNGMLMSKILNTLPKEYVHFHYACDSTLASDKTLHKLTSR